MLVGSVTLPSRVRITDFMERRFVAAVTRIVFWMLTVAQGKEGVLAYRTNKAIVIGHYSEHVQPGNAVNTIEPIAQYLIDIQY